MVDRNGRTRNFAYDALDRMTAETWLDAGGAAVNQVQYAFDAASRLTSASDDQSAYAFACDALSRVTSVDNQGSPGIPHVVPARSWSTRSTTGTAWCRS